MSDHETSVVLMHYARTGPCVWLAHLDMVRLFSRALNRAGWPLVWSEDAFNPRPDIVFGLPAGCGIEMCSDPVEVGVAISGAGDASSRTESFDVHAGIRRLDDVLPEGLSVSHGRLTARCGKSLMARVTSARYRIEAPGIGRAYEQTFRGGPVMVEHIRKNKSVLVDLFPRILGLDESSADHIVLRCGAGSVNHLRVDLLLEALVRDGGLDAEAASGARIVRESVFF